MNLLTILYCIALPKRSMHLRLRAVNLTVNAEPLAVVLFWSILGICMGVILCTVIMAIIGGIVS